MLISTPTLGFQMKYYVENYGPLQVVLFDLKYYRLSSKTLLNTCIFQHLKTHNVHEHYID